MLKRYFDALTTAYFKTAQDGRHLFCPWGIWGACYVIPSEQEYERRRRQLRNYLVATMALVAVALGAFQSYTPAVIAIALLFAFYLIWVRFLLRGLERSGERLSMQEATATQARTHSAAFLWLIEISSLVFVAGGIAVLIAEPGEWQMALGATGFFGLCAGFAAYMLVLRSRRTAS
jgi:hypothetical protein